MSSEFSVEAGCLSCGWWHRLELVSPASLGWSGLPGRLQHLLAASGTLHGWQAARQCLNGGLAVREPEWAWANLSEPQ